MKTSILLRKALLSIGSFSLFLFTLFTYLNSFAQNAPYLDRKAIGKLVYNRFSKISTGGTTGNNLVNAASIETLNGSWKLNGAIPITKKNSSRISILNVRAGGELLTGNTINLFTDSKLNSGSFIDLQYNIGLKNNDKNIRYLDTDAFLYKQKLMKIEYDGEKEYQSRMANRDVLKRLECELDSKIKTAETQMAEISNKQKGLRKDVNSCDELGIISRLSTELTKLTLDTLRMHFQKDSISMLLDRNAWDLKYNGGILRQEVNIKKARAITNLDDSAKIYSMYFVWFSISASMGHKSFYSYNWANPFATEVAKQSLNTYKVGTAVHYYTEFNKKFKNDPKELCNLYMNLGVQLYRDNNTDFLQSIDITEDHSYKNPTGDTVRKTSEKYKGYADSTLLISTVFNAYANAYLTLPHKFITLHFFPSVSSYYGGRVIGSIGTGCIFSFKTEKKEQPIVNVELFIQATDIFRKRAIDNYDYTTIGINLTHPINFIKN